MIPCARDTQVHTFYIYKEGTRFILLVRSPCCVVVLCAVILIASVYTLRDGVFIITEGLLPCVKNFALKIIT